MGKDAHMDIGLIGGGSVVESLHLPVLVRASGLRVKWVCDTSADRAKRVAKNWGINRAFSNLDECGDVDAVLIATPVGSRESILNKTLARGWHALCEKPFAPTAGLHREILAKARQKDVKLAAGYMRRYYWAVEEARRMVRSQTLGRLIGITAGESAHLERTGLSQSSYRNDNRASGGGVMLETGCHLIDQALFVVDATRARIETSTQKIVNGYEVETAASGFVTSGSGEEASFEIAVSGVRPIFQGILFRFEQGQIRIHLTPEKGLEIMVGRYSSSPIELPHPEQGKILQQILGAFRSEWLHFVDGVQGAFPWDMAKETGLLTSEVITECAELKNRAGIEVQECAL
jgi:predicted dehydrogenase